MPFVTEVLWAEFGLGAEGTLIRAPWPATVAVPGAEAARAELDWVVALIGAGPRGPVRDAGAAFGAGTHPLAGRRR